MYAYSCDIHQINLYENELSSFGPEINGSMEEVDFSSRIPVTDLKPYSIVNVRYAA